MDKSIEFLGKTLTVTIDRPMGSSHPTFGFLYPLNYGYLPGILSGDEEELDAYVLGVNEPLDTFTGRCIAIIQRLGEEDDKLIMVPEGITCSREEIAARTEFVEKYYRSEIWMEKENQK
ncbi:MAG: inorganic diphosphatase [Anaerolineales bacterium]|nr:inorganic diphosphatase [Anaerolineales bacterium]